MPCSDQKKSKKHREECNRKKGRKNLEGSIRPRRACCRKKLRAGNNRRNRTREEGEKNTTPSADGEEEKESVLEEIFAVFLSF